jgi:predicted branched-subunit amino acid permease
MDDLVLSLAMLTALGFIALAVRRWRRNGPSLNVWLMLGVALVLLVNVAIWVIPGPDGAAPIKRAASGPG